MRPRKKHPAERDTRDSHTDRYECSYQPVCEYESLAELVHSPRFLSLYDPGAAEELPLRFHPSHYPAGREVAWRVQCYLPPDQTRRQYRDGGKTRKGPKSRWTEEKAIVALFEGLQAHPECYPLGHYTQERLWREHGVALGANTLAYFARSIGTSAAEIRAMANRAFEEALLGEGMDPERLAAENRSPARRTRKITGAKELVDMLADALEEHPECSPLTCYTIEKLWRAYGLGVCMRSLDYLSRKLGTTPAAIRAQADAEFAKRRQGYRHTSRASNTGRARRQKEK